MKQALTQKQLITRFFRSHGVFSDAQAKQFGIRNLRARIDELRSEGFVIRRTETTRGGGAYRVEAAQMGYIL